MIESTNETQLELPLMLELEILQLQAALMEAHNENDRLELQMIRIKEDCERRIREMADMITKKSWAEPGPMIWRPSGPKW